MCKEGAALHPVKAEGLNNPMCACRRKVYIIKLRHRRYHTLLSYQTKKPPERIQGA